MSDRIFDAWLVRQLDEGLALAASSDRFDLVPMWTSAELLMGNLAPQHFGANFRCTGLVRLADGAIGEGNAFSVGIWFPPTYLRRANPFQTLTWIGPRNVWHPNISKEGPAICVGRIAPGMGLVDLLYQVFEIITYTKVTMHDALNHDAAAWARQNLHRFPVDRRPLRRPVARRTEAPRDGGANELTS